MTTTSSPPDHARTSTGTIGTRVSRGLGWSVGGQLVSRLGFFASGIVLARLLTPIDFGEVAAALVLVNILSAVNELGVSPALVRWQGDTTRASATATTIAFVNSIAMYLVAFALAPVVAEITNTPGSTGVTRIMALTILADGLVAVPLAHLCREIRTKAQMAAETAGMVAYVAVAVGLAAAGIDAEAVAWGRVLGAVVAAGIMIAVAPWPAPPAFDLRIARQLLGFGVPLALSIAVLEGVMNVDYLVVGRELSGAALGVYLLAFNLSNWPVSILGVAIGRVSFAGYAAIADDHERLVRGFLHSIAVAVSCIVPLVLTLVVLAPEVVGTVYGEQWAEAVAPVRWLLLVGGIRVLLQLAGELIAVAGKPASVLWIRLAWLAALPWALGAGAERGGLGGVAMAHVAVIVVLVLPLFLRQLERAGVSPRALARSAARPLVAAGAAGAAMLAASPVVEGDGTRLVVLGCIGGAVYGAVLLPRNRVVRLAVSQLRGEPVGQVA